MQTKVLRVVTVSLLLIISLIIPVSSWARDRGRGFVGSRPVIIHSYPGYWGGAWGAWNDPFWGGYSAPYYYDTRGKVKIKNANESDQIYVNGAYAGTVEKMKSLRLDPGKYNIEVRQQGRSIVDRDVYVVTGKTVKIYVNER